MSSLERTTTFANVNETSQSDQITILLSLTSDLNASGTSHGPENAQDSTTDGISSKDTPTHMQVEVQVSQDLADTGFLTEDPPLRRDLARFVEMSIRNQSPDALSEEIHDLKTEAKSESLMNRVCEAVHIRARLAKESGWDRYPGRAPTIAPGSGCTRAAFKMKLSNLAISLPDNLRVPRTASEDYAYDLPNWKRVPSNLCDLTRRVSEEGNLQATLSGLYRKPTKKQGGEETFEFGTIHPWAAAEVRLYQTECLSRSHANGRGEEAVKNWAELPGNGKKLDYALNKYLRFAPIVKSHQSDATTNTKAVAIDQMTISDEEVQKFASYEGPTYELEILVPSESWIGA